MPAACFWNSKVNGSLTVVDMKCLINRHQWYCTIHEQNALLLKTPWLSVEKKYAPASAVVTVASKMSTPSSHLPLLVHIINLLSQTWIAQWQKRQLNSARMEELASGMGLDSIAFARKDGEEWNAQQVSVLVCLSVISISLILTLTHTYNHSFCSNGSQGTRNPPLWVRICFCRMVL